LIKKIRSSELPEIEIIDDKADLKLDLKNPSPVTKVYDEQNEGGEDD
jgi:hypothetical protein